MFASVALRLTTWYVAATVVLVTLVLSILAVVALTFYTHFLNETMESDVREAQGFAERAVARHQPFAAAAIEFENRVTRTGVHTIAFPRAAYLPRYDVARRQSLAATAYLDGHQQKTIVGRFRENGSGFGRGVLELTGAHPQIGMSFVGGRILFYPDPDNFANFAFGLFGLVLLAAAVSGVLAWTAGRFITQSAIQPLVDVTHALQRFAARDFSPQAIDVPGKSEFDALAYAYNAAATQVAEAFAEREAAESQMRQFVADAGHELRTPLTIVLGYIDVLRRRAADDERSRRIFETIAVESGRMRTLIDNLVLLTRLDSDEERPIEPFDLTELLTRDVVEPRRALAPRVRFDLDIAVDATVIGDRAEIYEAIANVVDNARKYAPDSPITLRVRAAGTAVEIDVADAGPGIPAEDRPAVFDRFYRGASRGEVEGSGLGLAIAKRVIERAGGTLTLLDTVQGATFRFRLRADSIRARRDALR
jgi:signal transduction histidine kinase